MHLRKCLNGCYQLIIILLAAVYVECSASCGGDGNLQSPACTRTRLYTPTTLQCIHGIEDVYRVRWLDSNNDADVLVVQYRPSRSDPLTIGTDYTDRVMFYTANFTLLLKNVTLASEGHFYCDVVATNTDVEVYYNELRVFLPPQRVDISTPDTNNEVQEGGTSKVACIVPTVYPSHSLEISIAYGDEILEVLPNATYSYEVNVDSTFNARAEKDVRFLRDYNTNKLSCRVRYTGPGTGSQVSSSHLNIEVHYCDMLQINGNSAGNKQVGDTVDITCTTACFPAPRIRLYRATESLHRGQASTTLARQRSLVKEDHRMDFYCRIDGRNDLDSNDVIYTIIFSATSITKSVSPSGDVSENSQLTIECLTDEANPTATIVWSDTVVSNIATNDADVGGCCNAKKKKSTLTFTAHRQDNTRSVTCALQNDLDIKQSHTISVKFQPTVIQMSRSNSDIPKAGDSIAFTCTTDSLNPVDRFVEMRWRREDSPGSNRIPLYDDLQFTPTPGMYGGMVVSSTYTFTVTKEDNGAFVTCVPRWREGSTTNGLTGIQQYQTLTVYYRPMVSISGCGNDQNEGDICTLSCDATGGNPSTGLNYRWQFKPKFDGEFEDFGYTGDPHVLSDITYTDAGDYKCIVSNAGGSAQDTRTVTVTYAPVAIHLDPDSTNTKTFYANSGSDITMWLTVHNFPNDAEFSWSKGSRSLADTVDRTDDRANSSITIRSAGGNDYGRYNVRVTNDVGRNNYIVELQQNSKPDPASALSIESRSYREIIISFMPGLDGGFEQTITAEITSDGRSSSDGAGEIVNPVQQERHDITISANIDPSTTYVIRLASENAFERGSATLSESINVTTRAKVKVKGGELTVKVKGSDVILSWPLPEPADFTALTVEQCQSQNTDCIYHDVTGLLEVTLDRYNGTECTLMVMQDRDTAYAASFQVEEEDGGGGDGGEAGPPLAVMIGAIVGSLILVVVIAGLVIVILRKRREGGKNKKEKSDAQTTLTDNTGEEPNAPIYGKVDLSKKKKNRAQQPVGEAAGDAPNAVYAQVDPRTKKNNRAAEAKPAPKAPARSLYTNVPQHDLGENPYSNVQDLQQGNPAPSEQGPYAPRPANVSYPPPAAPAADTKNLIYADSSFDRGQPGTAPKPQIIHGAEDTVEYSTVDFNRSAPAPQDSESEDEEDVNKRQ